MRTLKKTSISEFLIADFLAPGARSSFGVLRIIFHFRVGSMLRDAVLSVAAGLREPERPYRTAPIAELVTRKILIIVRLQMAKTQLC